MSLKVLLADDSSTMHQVLCGRCKRLASPIRPKRATVRNFLPLDFKPNRSTW